MSGDELYRGRRVAVLAPASVAGELGGAERLYAGLHEALRQQGCAADLLTIPFDEANFDAIMDGYERCRAMDLSRYDLVISTKAPTYAVRHPRHVVYLVHTVRVFYDMFDTAFPWATEALARQRRRIQQFDTQALAGAKRRFAIGHEVAARLRAFNGLDAEVLHPPLGMDRFRQGHSEGYFFLPGRLHPWKRVDLAIRAVRGSRHALRLRIAGTGEAEADLRVLAAGDPRIEFLGRISDEALLDQYAGCLAVPFVPVREDYGYVTLEAFASGKPVITCTDSGEPVQFVAHGRNGWICEPTPESLREAMEACFLDAGEAARMGQRGLQVARAITWPAAARRLLQAGFAQADAAASTPPPGDGEVKVAVLDMQPIEPAVGGGRLRLLGLYHALGANMPTRYVGSYDWPGERFRRQQLTATLEEIVVPLSDAHHAAARRLSREAGDKVVIDIAFPRLGHLSADYLEAAREAVDWADVVVVSHPWAFPLVADRIRQAQLVVYDAHNVEGFLRAQLLDTGNAAERDLLRGVIDAEYKAGLRADLVLACSEEDRAMLERVYEWPAEKIRLAPNGVMARSIVPADARERAEARSRLGVAADAFVAVFIGSAYGPNVEAARFIVEALAPALPQVVFLIVGGVGDGVGGAVPANVRVTGVVDDEAKRRWLQAADIAVNPMFSGSGTNIKMFDFMAAGLPVVTTSIGSRGIGDAEGLALRVAGPAPGEFVAAIGELRDDVELRRRCGARARAIVEGGYAWERISPALGELLRRSLQEKTLRRAGAPRRRMAILTTWNTQCGIAEHAAYLAAALEDFGWEVVILGNELPPSGPTRLAVEMNVPCVRVWRWDNVAWVGSEADQPRIRDALTRLAPDVLLIQHHTGFLGGDAYAAIIRTAGELNVPVLLEMHNARELARSDGAGPLAAADVTLIAHDVEEAELLRASHRARITTIPLPIRVSAAASAGDARHPSPAPGQGGPLIGGFGFLRPHKGVKKAIQVVAALKPAHPGIRYVGYHAGYQTEESVRYLQECRAEAARLGVAEAVTIDTAFHDIDEVVRRLREVDVVLLPYEPSFEGASASANIAVAAGRPTVTSSSRIFNPLREVVLMADDDRTPTYVDLIDRLLRDGDLARSYEDRARRWAQEHSYAAAARRLAELAPVRQPAD